VDPGNPLLLNRLAACDRQTGDVAGIVRALRRACDSDRKAFRMRLELAALEQRLGNSDRAQNLARHLATIAETDDERNRVTELEAHLAFLFLRLGHARHFAQLGHLALGVELGRLGNPALAEQEFQQALRLDPDFIQARVDLGIALFEQNKMDEALKQFWDVLQRNPNDATALHYLQLLLSRVLF